MYRFAAVLSRVGRNRLLDVPGQLNTELTPTLRAEIIRWIRAAKSPATRERRLEVGTDRLEEMAHPRRSSR